MEWYKHKIAIWTDGTGKLSDGAYRAYHVIVQLIYLHEGPIELNERGIAGLCNQRLDRFRANLAECVKLEKLRVEGNKIYNGRCAAEIADFRHNGGKKPKKKPAGQVWDNDGLTTGHRTVSASKPLKTNDASRQKEEKERIEESHYRGGTRIPADWSPSEGDRMHAELVGILNIDTEASLFRDHYLAAAGTAGMRADWSAAWRKWCTNAIQQRKKYEGKNGTAHQHQNGRAHPSGSKRTNSDVLLAGMAAALSKSPRSRLYDGDRGRSQGEAGHPDDSPRILAIAGPDPGSGTPH